MATPFGACRGGARETFVTFFDGDHGLSLRHPAAWRTDVAKQDGASYRYFLAPPVGPEKRGAVSVTLIATALAGSLEDYAQGYLSGQQLLGTRTEERQGVSGRSWTLSGGDGKTRSRLLLLASEGRGAGLHAQGDATAMERHAATLDLMFESFTVERPDRYPVQAWSDFETSLGVPDSWRQTQRFAGGGTMLIQFASPPLAVERRQTIHAALSVTLEPAPGTGGLGEYYDTTRRKLGDNYVVTSHQAFRGGYVDVMRTETSLAVSYIKRYYFARAGRACSLSFEAREDVFPQAARWADYIASSLKLGPASSDAAGGPSR